jgi:CHASE3 domain sensor protein
MIKKKAFVLIGVLTIVIVSFSLWLNLSTSRAKEGIPQTQEAKQIQEVIQRSYKLEALAGRTFDISDLALSPRA